MNAMKIKIIVFAASLVITSTPYAAFAAGSSNQTNAALNSLAGTAVTASQLNGMRARGNIIVSSIDNGSVTGNSVGNNSTTGSINDSQSINNNAGLTTIFQNTGNNSLIQNSTSIYISVH